MGTFVKPIKMLVLVINACFFIIVQGDKEHLSNYTDAKASCHNRGGIITQKMLKFDGLINMTAELGFNDGVLNDGESVWVQGRAQTGPYIALHTCMRFNNQDFARKKTFYSNILYECSVFCDLILHSMGFFGIFKDSCLCMYTSFTFPRTSGCLINDFMDIHKRIVVFSLIGDQMQFDVRYKSSDFNCVGAWFRKDAPITYFNTKCVSNLHGICTKRVDSYLSSNCQPRMGEFCFTEDENTFLEHYRQCWLYSGTLTPFFSRLGASFSYVVMLGSFRAFKAIEDDGEENVNWSCLSMTQFNGIIYLETEHCSNGNAFICMDDIDISKISESGTKIDSYKNVFNTSGSETKDDLNTKFLDTSGSETKDDLNTKVLNTSGSETKDDLNTKFLDTSGSETKNDSKTKVLNIPGSETNDDSNTNVLNTSGSETKDGSNTKGLDKSGSETKDDSKTKVFNTSGSGSETKDDSNLNVFNSSGSETKDHSMTNDFNTSRSEAKNDSTTNIRHYFIIICSILVSVVIMLALSHVWSLYRRQMNNRPRRNDGTSQNDMYITAITDERSENDATHVVETAAYDEAEETDAYNEIV